MRRWTETSNRRRPFARSTPRRLPMSVTTMAIDNIREMIADGRLKPGDRLPPEHALAEQLGVSRGSLREAVRALSQLNVLVVRRGDGTYVRSLEPSDLLSGLVHAIELVPAHGLDEVLEVRRLLLPPAAALAAQRVTAKQLDELRRLPRGARGRRRRRPHRAPPPRVPGARGRGGGERMVGIHPRARCSTRVSRFAGRGSSRTRRCTRSRSPTSGRS